MAQIVKRANGRFLARIRRKGHPDVSDTFSSEKDAQAWADKIERGIERGSHVDHKELRDTEVRDLLTRFLEEVTPERSNPSWEKSRINYFLRQGWAHLGLNQDVGNALLKWRNRRAEEIKGQSVNREMGFLSGIFTHARKEWRYGFDNPCATIKKCEEIDGERDVTWSPQDLQLFLDEFKFNPDEPVRFKRQYAAWVLVLANLTGLRRGTLCHTRISWINLPRLHIRYPGAVVKNRDDYNCPLSPEAIDMLGRFMKLREGEEKLFPTSAGYLSNQIRVARAKIAETHPHVLGLTLHDQRHTWTTNFMMKRVGEGKSMDKYTLMKITGRKSEKELLRYFNPDIEELARML